MDKVENVYRENPKIVEQIDQIISFSGLDREKVIKLIRDHARIFHLTPEEATKLVWQHENAKALLRLKQAESERKTFD